VQQGFDLLGWDFISSAEPSTGGVRPDDASLRDPEPRRKFATALEAVVRRAAVSAVHTTLARAPRAAGATTPVAPAGTGQQAWAHHCQGDATTPNDGADPGDGPQDPFLYQGNPERERRCDQKGDFDQQDRLDRLAQALGGQATDLGGPEARTRTRRVDPRRVRYRVLERETQSGIESAAPVYNGDKRAGALSGSWMALGARLPPLHTGA